MPRKENQKAKILILLKILEQNTDEQHRLTVPELIDALDAEGVPCERKSIYADIDALRQMGYDIELQRGPGGGYYLASREFQLAELKLLVDAVQSSRFITQKKSHKLIAKLEKLTSKHEARLLHRQVFVAGRAKSDNEAGLYAVDALHDAISENRMVEFVYSEWGLDKKKHARRSTPYRVSPWALAWENDGYYLIAYQDYDQPGIRHYRVDKMTRVTKLDESRRGREVFENFNLSAYMQGMFNMFSAPERTVTLRCQNKLANAMLDRFGTGITLIPEEDGMHFHFDARVAASSQFFGWVCGFGGAVQITAPADLRAELFNFADYIAAVHR